MKKYIYITNSSKIKSFLKKIQSVGVPNKLTIKELEKLGFKSQNDRPLIRIMKAIDFISEDGVPTNNWISYRDKKKAGYVLAEGIRKYYAELFRTYPKANHQDNKTLRDFFTAETEVGDRMVGYMVSTFNALKEFANFEIEKLPKEKRDVPEEREEKNIHKIPDVEKLPPPQAPSLHFDFQIHISPEAKPEQIDKIFESIAKHFEKFYLPKKSK